MGFDNIEKIQSQPGYWESIEKTVEKLERKEAYRRTTAGRRETALEVLEDASRQIDSAIETLIDARKDVLFARAELKATTIAETVDE